MKRKVTASLLLSGIVLGIVGVMALNFPLAPVGAAPGARRLNQTTVYLDPVADAYVSEGAPTTNFGSDTWLDVQNLDGEIPEDRRSYVGFDLSSIPSNAIISSAAFKAYLDDAQGLSNVYIQLRRVTSPWAYNTVTWNNKPSSNSYTGMYVDTRIGMKGWDVTSLVQGYWINRDFGTSPNFGLELRGPESGAYYLRSFTSNNASSNRPYLVVSYELPTPTPTSTPESDFSDLDLAMVTVMNSNDFVDPEPFTVVQGARFRLSVFVSIITEFSGGMETFDRDSVQVKVSGSQQEAIGDQDPNGQSTLSMIRTLGNGEPTLFVGDYWTTTLLDPGLYHEHLRVVFPSQPEQLNDDGVQFQSTFSDMQAVRPDWVSNVIDVQLPRLRYIQNQYNDHVDPQGGYVAEYLSPGRDNDSTFLVYTFDVSTEYLNPGLWTMNVVVDEPGIIAEYNEGNNASGDISWEITAHEFASEDEVGDIGTVSPPEGEEESVAPGPCDPWGWGGTPPTDIMAAGVYRVRYLYDVVLVWPLPPIFVPEFRDVPHLFMWNDQGVSKLTRNGVYIGEIFGPFGHHCTNTRWAGDPYQRSCLEGHYGYDLNVVGDQPYNASCDPGAADYITCRDQLKSFDGRPKPWQIENVMVFFPGVLGGDAGSMVTGQTGCSSSLGDCSDWGPNDEANAALYDKGDQFHLLRIKHDSIAGRLMGLVEAYAQYSPQDTLLTAVFDPEIDSSERQDNELLNALEYYIAKRTNMYDNVKVIWIAGGSRGGSTAFYLMRKIKDRLMGEYGVDHYHDSPLTIKLLATGIDAVSQANDVQGCSPNISGYRRLVTDAWNLGDSTHGNGHNMNVLFDQTGTGFNPNLHVLQIIGEVRNRDSMIHIEADSSSAEQDARLPAIRDADPDVIYEDLVYKYPENGLEGGFYSQWWPVFTTSPTDAPYEHDHLTRDYRPPNGPKTLNWFFNNAGWGDFIDYDGLQSCHPEVCDNGMDDDHNGYTDCQDVRSCRYDDHCNERNFCTNGADDDHDGLVDCEDPDCAPRTRSFGEPCYTVHQDCTLRNPDPGTCRRAGDGYADLAIGVPLEDIGGATDAGAVHILYGSSPSGLTAAGSAIWGQFADPAEDDDKFGHSLAAGDFDGDGYMDLAIGVPDETVGSVTGAGAVNIMYGAAGGFFSARAEIWHQDTGSIHSLAETDDRFGYTLAVGDFNGDGRDDLAVGLPYEDWNETDTGIVQILYGSDTGLTDSGNQLWRQGSDGITEPEESRDRFGFALAAGDFNRDGYADLAIGAPEEDFEEVPVNGVGVVHILHGSAAGLTSANWQVWRQIEADTNDRFGYTLTTGDFDGDGYADLAVGAPYEDVGLPEVRDAGAVDVLYGSAAGLSATGHQILDGGNGAEEDDRFGFALTGGDFNGDGYADLAVGIPYEDLPAGATDVLDAGAVEIFYGAPGGLIRRVANDFWHQDRSGMEDQPEASDLFGRVLASGDFDGDDYADLAVGIPFKDIHDPGDNEGAVHILYGSADGISSAGCWFFHQDTTGIGGNAQPRDNFGKALAAIPLIRIRAYLPLVLHDYP